MTSKSPSRPKPRRTNPEADGVRGVEPSKSPSRPKPRRTGRAELENLSVALQVEISVEAEAPTHLVIVNAFCPSAGVVEISVEAEAPTHLPCCNQGLQRLRVVEISVEAEAPTHPYGLSGLYIPMAVEISVEAEAPTHWQRGRCAG